jgi:N-acetyl-gamma-glutamyl-phosphate reductase
MTTRNNGRLTAGVVGATGTTGVELVRTLERHPGLKTEFATSRELAGQCLTSIDPSAPATLLSAPEEVDPSAVDVVFLCLPHGASAPVAEAMLEQGARAVVDLSGDLRLTDRWQHEKTYGSARDQALADEAVYGLPELRRADLHQGTRLVANPGCYATAVALALLPLAESGDLPETAYVDAKSGVSGAGRAATAATHFCSAHDDIRPYKVGRVHRHVPEMEQTLQRAGADSSLALVFVPHLVPLERGILATCAVRGSGLDEDAAHDLYQARYADEPFVRLEPAGQSARIRAAAYTNRAVISVHGVPDQDLLVIACAIDNLGKGAAGQAVQNANLLLGRPETEGLRGF